MNIFLSHTCFIVICLLITVRLSATSIASNTQENTVDVKEEPGPGGIWKSTMKWQAHWVKHWETRQIWIPIWRKVWGPIETKEWIPFPKPPPTWTPPQQTIPPF